jgi:hypothetical protein
LIIVVVVVVMSTGIVFGVARRCSGNHPYPPMCVCVLGCVSVRILEYPSPTNDAVTNFYLSTKHLHDRRGVILCIYHSMWRMESLWFDRGLDVVVCVCVVHCAVARPNRYG